MGNVPMPKQFLLLNDKPILVHTVEKFVLNPRFDKVIIASPKEWLNYTQDILKKFQIDLPKVVVVEGGSERNDTIMNIIDYMENENGLEDDAVVVTNNAVRPFLNQHNIEENIDMGLEYGAVDTVIEAIDTIVEASYQRFISDIPRRDIMFQGQT